MGLSREEPRLEQWPCRARGTQVTSTSARYREARRELPLHVIVRQDENVLVHGKRWLPVLLREDTSLHLLQDGWM